jgi:hypothetical protein
MFQNVTKALERGRILWLHVNNGKRTRNLGHGTCLKETAYENVDWLHLAQERDQWWARVRHDKEPSDSIKRGEFLDRLSDCRLLKKGSVPCSDFS